MDDVIRHTADAVDSGFMKEAMADEFLRFLAGYIKVEKVKTEAIQDFITLDLWLTFLRKRVGKNMKISS